jgi:hypothetical protein
VSDITIRGEGADWVAWVAVLISIGALALTWYWNRRNESRSTRDSYWFREVLAPSCLDPVRKFRDQWTQTVLGIVGQQLTVEKAQQLISAAQLDLAKLRRDMWLAELFKGTFFHDTGEILDQIEDSIAAKLSLGVTGSGPFNDDAARTLIDDITIRCMTILRNAASLHDGKLQIQEQ